MSKRCPSECIRRVAKEMFSEQAQKTTTRQNVKIDETDIGKKRYKSLERADRRMPSVFHTPGPYEMPKPKDTV